MKKIIIAMLLLMSFLNFLYSAEDNGTASVSLVIQSLFDLTLTNTAVNQTLSGTTLSTAYANGYTEMTAGQPTARIDANEGWYLKVKAASTNFTYTGSGVDPVKPCGDLMMKDVGTVHVATGWDTYNTLTTTDQTFAAHTAGVTGEMHQCRFRINLNGLIDIPGTYSLNVTYTLTTTA